MKDRSKLALGIAFVAGILIGVYDSGEQNWMATGLSAAAIVLSASTMSFMAPRVFGFIALATGIWIPILGWSQSGPGTTLALVFALGAAYFGSLSARFIARDEKSPPSTAE